MIKFDCENEELFAECQIARHYSGITRAVSSALGSTCTLKYSYSPLWRSPESTRFPTARAAAPFLRCSAVGAKIPVPTH